MRPNKWIFTFYLCANASNAFAQSDTSEFEKHATESRAQYLSGPLPGEDPSSMPAVDGVNSNLSGGLLGGDNEAIFATGSVTIPIGHSFGLQIDGVAAEVFTDLYGNIPVYAAAAHAFWRDPSIGLLGLYGDIAYVDFGSRFDLYTAGIEGALYLDRFSVNGVAAAQKINDFDEEFFGESNLIYYPMDDFALHIGQSYMLGANSLQYGAEWALPGQGASAASLFAQGALHEGGKHTFELGLRMYFGNKEKSLIRRHREDDPNVIANAPGLVFIPISGDGNYTIVVGNSDDGNTSNKIYPYGHHALVDN